MNRLWRWTSRAGEPQAPARPSDLTREHDECPPAPCSPTR